VALIVIGCLAIISILDPGLFSSESSPHVVVVTGSSRENEKSTEVTQVAGEVTTTANGVYCNCTDTYSQG
jgi:hypothetical protein